MSSIENKEIAADIINFFYPNSNTTAYDITNGLGDLAAEMLEEALEASTAMHFVPRPSYTPSFSWLGKEAVKAFWRSKGKDEIYDSVRNSVARNFRSAFEMEKMGI